MRTLAVVLAVVTTACDTSSSPAGPTSVGGSLAAAPYSVTGQVYDTIIRPIADVHIEVIDGPRAGTSAVTGTDGRYQLPGTFSGPISIRATKEAYVTTVKRYDPQTQEPPYVWFRLALSSSVDLTGMYTVTLAADSACALPQQLRIRTYAAEITTREPYLYEVQLTGGAFLAAPFPGRFYIRVAGTVGDFHLGDYDLYDAIVEELGPSTYIAIRGFGLLPLDTTPIAGSLSFGEFEYCEAPDGMRPVRNGRYQCPTEPITCRLQLLQLARR